VNGRGFPRPFLFVRTSQNLSSWSAISVPRITNGAKGQSPYTVRSANVGGNGILGFEPYLNKCSLTGQHHASRVEDINRRLERFPQPLNREGFQRR
jgi:hypothetical protein